MEIAYNRHHHRKPFSSSEFIPVKSEPQKFYCPADEEKSVRRPSIGPQVLRKLNRKLTEGCGSSRDTVTNGGRDSRCMWVWGSGRRGITRNMRLKGTKAGGVEGVPYILHTFSPGTNGKQGNDQFDARRRTVHSTIIPSLQQTRQTQGPTKQDYPTQTTRHSQTPPPA